MTLLKVAKTAIAIGPPAVIIGSDIAASPNAAGLRTAAGDFTSFYTGWNANTGQFDWSKLAIGYVPAAGAYFFGKIFGRLHIL